MIYAAIATTAMLLAIHGEKCQFAGVLKVDRSRGDPNLWYAMLYSGGPDERMINPAKIDIAYVDPKRKDPFTGRLLLDEMRDLVKSRDLVYIWFHRKDGGAEDMVTTIQPYLKMKLQVPLPP